MTKKAIKIYGNIYFNAIISTLESQIRINTIGHKIQDLSLVVHN